VAQSIAGERGTALFTYYGWRIQIFSVVPNVTNIKRAAADEETPFPWFNLAFAVIILGGIAWLFCGFAVSGLGAARRAHGSKA